MGSSHALLGALRALGRELLFDDAVAHRIMRVMQNAHIMLAALLDASRDNIAIFNIISRDGLASKIRRFDGKAHLTCIWQERTAPSAWAEG